MYNFLVDFLADIKKHWIIFAESTGRTYRMKEKRKYMQLVWW